MKTIVTIALLLVSSLGVFANNNFSQLVVFSENNDMLSMQIDGDYLAPSQNIYLDRVNAGNHFVKIFKHYTSACGKFNYKETVFSGYLDIPFRKKVTALVNRYDQFHFQQIEPIYTCATQQPFYNNHHYNNLNNGNHYGQHKNPKSHHNMGFNTSCSNNNTNNFFQLKRMMQNTSFDNSKLQVAQQAMQYNNYSSQQIRELASLFTFDSYKYQFLEIAYQNVYDPHNYFVVNDVFTFDSYKHKLAKACR